MMDEKKIRQIKKKITNKAQLVRLILKKHDLLDTLERKHTDSTTIISPYNFVSQILIKVFTEGTKPIILKNQPICPGFQQINNLDINNIILLVEQAMDIYTLKSLYTDIDRIISEKISNLKKTPDILKLDGFNIKINLYKKHMLCQTCRVPMRYADTKSETFCPQCNKVCDSSHSFSDSMVLTSQNHSRNKSPYRENYVNDSIINRYLGVGPKNITEKFQAASNFIDASIKKNEIDRKNVTDKIVRDILSKTIYSSYKKHSLYFYYNITGKKQPSIQPRERSYIKNFFKHLIRTYHKINKEDNFKGYGYFFYQIVNRTLIIQDPYTKEELLNNIKIPASGTKTLSDYRELWKRLISQNMKLYRTHTAAPTKKSNSNELTIKI